MAEFVTVTLEHTDAVIALKTAMERVGDGTARRAFSLAMNERGRVGYTAVKRALANQTSIPRAAVEQGTRFDRSSPDRLAVAVVGFGGGLSLKVFGARQISAGVTAKVWGKTKTFEGLFMGPRPGLLAPALNGHAFYRKGSSRLPIKKGMGPGIAKELVKDASAAAFTVAVADMSRAFDRILRAIGDGKIPAA